MNSDDPQYSDFMNAPYAKTQDERNEFLKLKKEWYKKLKKTGFKDLEYASKWNARGQDFPIESATSIHKRCFSLEIQQHYQRCSVFLAHCPPLSNYDYFLFKNYTDGLSYREILAKYKKKYPKRKKGTSLFTFHRIFKRLQRELAVWHLTNPEGYDYTGDNIAWEESDLLIYQPKAKRSITHGPKFTRKYAKSTKL